jgi:hypothetical protein
MLDDRERKFASQSEEFVAAALNEFAIGRDPAALPRIAERLAFPLQPILIEDFRAVSPDHRRAIAEAYHGENGVAYCIILNPTDQPTSSHPLLDLADTLAGDLPLNYPLTHPMEGHPEAVSRFGPADGTLKIYDLDTKDARFGYREQAETSEMFSAHNDGLGYAGAVEAVAFFMDSAPLWGGYTYFQNLIRLAIDLMRSDDEAFRALFLPDAITAIRPRGKGAIKVTSPVLFLNNQRRPQCFYRVSTGEYQIAWRNDSASLERARRFLDQHTHPFAPGSSFVHLTAAGHCCFIRNEAVVHGRTPFLDVASLGLRRVLARKWFMRDPKDAVYKHVPGMEICREYAVLYPELFGDDRLLGEWNYDATSDRDIRKQ